MKFHSNKHREGQVRVQPEHKQTAVCGTPIANAEVNTTRREDQEELLATLWDLSCQTLDAVSRYKSSVEPGDFKTTDDYNTSRDAWRKHTVNLYKFHEFIHSHHVHTSWTEWKDSNETEEVAK